MKAIELAQEQRDKLMDMIGDLYPEYEEAFLGYKPYHNHSSIYMTKDYENYIILHWFEFCVLHLPETIFRKLIEIGFNDYSQDDYIDWLVDYQSNTAINGVDCHPVDYLYEEFKKLQGESK